MILKTELTANTFSCGKSQATQNLVNQMVLITGHMKCMMV